MTTKKRKKLRIACSGKFPLEVGSLFGIPAAVFMLFIKKKTKTNKSPKNKSKNREKRLQRLN